MPLFIESMKGLNRTIIYVRHFLNPNEFNHLKHIFEYRKVNNFETVSES